MWQYGAIRGIGARNVNYLYSSFEVIPCHRICIVISKYLCSTKNDFLYNILNETNISSENDFAYVILI